MYYLKEIQHELHPLESFSTNESEQLGNMTQNPQNIHQHSHLTHYQPGIHILNWHTIKNSIMQ